MKNIRFYFHSIASDTRVRGFQIIITFILLILLTVLARK